jgi:hypothetical protein
MTLADFIFLTALSFLLLHELDAIQQHEWRFFFARIPISDEIAYRIFTAAHLPLFIFILWYAKVSAFQTGMDIFLIIHAGLHWFLRHHPKITFNNGFSRLWIFGGSVFGTLHLILIVNP